MQEIIEQENNIEEENSRLLTVAATGPSEYGSSTASQPDRHNMAKENKIKYWPQYVASLSAAGGALACGLCLGWSSLTAARIKEGTLGFKVTDEEFSWVGSFMNLGAGTICIPIGILMNAIGRKPSMLLLVLPFVLGWVLLIFAQNVAMLFVARYVLGIAGGAFCVTAPAYTGEIASKEIRGTLGSFFQLLLTVGILLAYGLGWALEVGTLSIVCGLVPIAFGIVFFFMPESPTYLVSKGRNDSAVKSMKWLRGRKYDTEEELAELVAIDTKIKENKVTLRGAFSKKVTIKAMLMGLGLMFFQQMSGINAVIFYTGDIFSDAKTGIDGNLATVIVGVMQVIATFISTMVVDKLGRRLLLLTSGFVMMICTILLGIYFFMQSHDAKSVENMGWLPVISLCVFIVMFSFGYGPVPWLMMGEIFASDVKGICGSIAGTFNWLLAFLITKTFVNLKELMGPGQTFWLFSGLTLVGIVFVWFGVIETKGKSLQEIQVEMGETPVVATPTSSK